MKRGFLGVVLLSIINPFSLKSSTLNGDPPSVRTNLIWAASSTPNLGVEIPVGDNWSVGGNMSLKPWPRWLAWDWDNKTNATHWRSYAVVPEVRYYFSQIYEGFFTGADFLYSHYNVGAIDFPLYPELKEERVQGSYWAGGLFVGYAWWPWQHWRLELEAGAAFGLAAYDRFNCPHCGTKLGEERKPAFFPKLGLNVAWNPVSKEETKRRRAEKTLVVSRKDTITVLTPPVAFVVHTRPVQEPESTGDKLSKEYSWVIPIEEYRPFDYLTHPGRDSLQYVRFNTDSYRLESGLLDNAERLGQIENAIKAVKMDDMTDEMLISIVGLASIEGPEEYNDSLSVKRGRALASRLSENCGLRLRFFEILGKGEAWDWFRDQATVSSDTELLEILNDDTDPDRRERKIRSSASLYDRVKRDYLGEQRNAGYLRVYYGDSPDAATSKLNRIMASQINSKRYADAVREIEKDKAVMARVMEDAEAMNVYAVALYFTALDRKDFETEARAMKLLEKASAMGSDCARENLKGAKIYSPARKEYDAWLKVMSE